MTVVYVRLRSSLTYLFTDSYVAVLFGINCRRHTACFVTRKSFNAIFRISGIYSGSASKLWHPPLKVKELKIPITYDFMHGVTESAFFDMKINRTCCKKYFFKSQ